MGRVTVPPAGFAVVRFDGIDSTNREVAERARACAPAGLVVVADHQTAGRGRLGRSWSDEPGSSLLVSILLRPELEASALFVATAVVALALSDACHACAGVRPALKWPNDLLLGDRKVAGVLSEALWPPVSGGPGPAVVVGTGCNVTGGPPPGTAGTATTLEAASGRRVERDELLDAFLAGLAPRLVQLGSRDGLPAQLGEYRRRCATLGRRVAVEWPDGRKEVGLATGLADDGRLVVTADDGSCRAVAAADVTHLHLLAPPDGRPEEPARPPRRSAGSTPPARPPRRTGGG